MASQAPPKTKRRADHTRQQIAAVVAHPANLAAVTRIEHGSKLVPFDLWPEQVKLLDWLMEPGNKCLLKARQLGATWLDVCLLGLWENIAYPVGTTLCISVNLEEAMEAIRRTMVLYENTPAWFRKAFPLGIDNATEVGVQHEKGVSSLAALSSSGKAGRGRTFRRIAADEKAHWDPGSRMTSLLPSAADVGAVHELSTANGFNAFHRRYMGAVAIGENPEDGNNFTRYFIGALARPDRDEAWVMRQRAIVDEEDPGKGAQEYPLTAMEAFATSGACIFDRDVLQDYLANICTRPKRIVALVETDKVVRGVKPSGEDFTWKIWRSPQRAHRYVVAADSAGGTPNGDFSAAAIFDRDTWEQVASFHHRLPPEDFADQLWRAGWLFRSKDEAALMVPESNNHGQGTIARLRSLGYPNIYRDESRNLRADKMGEQLGFATTEKTKLASLAALRRGLDEYTLMIRDEEAIEECGHFVQPDINQATGRLPTPRAEEGHHDDHVSALWITATILLHSGISRKRGPRQPVEVKRSPRTGWQLFRPEEEPVY